MRVNYANETIEKPQGRRTAANTLRFEDLRRYIEIFKDVVDVKSAADAVSGWVNNGYPQERVIEVLRSVIVRFGGGHRIWGRFGTLYEASVADMNCILAEAHRRRDEDMETLRTILRDIKGLGGLAYSTKMLRFLNPKHVVLDSNLREEFCLVEADYQSFATHCRKIAGVLGVNPVDVESGLYAYVQIANPNQRQRDWKRHKT